MALRGWRIKLFLELGCLGASGGLDIWVSSTIKKVTSAGFCSLRQKRGYNSTWDFMILPKNVCFQNIKIKLNPTTWMTLKSSLVIFQTKKAQQPLWPHQPQWPHWPKQPLQPYFIKEFPGSDSWIIPGNKNTNTGPFSVESINKNPIFHWYLILFCLRLLRPADVTFLLTSWWNSNVHNSWSH